MNAVTTNETATLLCSPDGTLAACPTKGPHMNDLVPRAVVDLLPEGLREYALYLMGGVICIGAVIALMLLLAVARFLFGGGKKVKEDGKLAEDLAEYPELKKSSGD